MLRLTLRAREDGRYLARVIERDGFAFVLDYGDAVTVADASERISRGFVVWRHGERMTVTPGSSDLLKHLAEYYAQEGLLVNLEDQGFSRTGTQTPMLDLDDLQEADDETELVELNAGDGTGPVALGEHPVITSLGDLGIHDDPTDIRYPAEADTLILPRPVLARQMYTPDLGGTTLVPGPADLAETDDETELVPLDLDTEGPPTESGSA